MGEGLREDVEIQFTEQQKQKYSDASGITLQSLCLTPENPRLFLLLAESLRLGKLPQGFWLATTIDLTPDQQAQVQQVTGHSVFGIMYCLTG